jgi:hypothetical protein
MDEDKSNWYEVVLELSSLKIQYPLDVCSSCGVDSLGESVAGELKVICRF